MEMITLQDQDRHVLAVDADDYEDTVEAILSEDRHVLAHWEALEIIKAERLENIRAARQAFIPFVVMVVCFWNGGNERLGLLLDIILSLIALGASAVFMIRLGQMCQHLQAQGRTVRRGLWLFLLCSGRIVGWTTSATGIAVAIYFVIRHGARDELSMVMGFGCAFGALLLALFCEIELWNASIPGWEAAGIRIRPYRFGN